MVPEDTDQTRVMLVEDDPTIAATAQEGLESLAYGVIGPFASGEDAVAALPGLDPKPDVVLMDINLAGVMDGIEAAEIIHREHGLPIVYASALHDEPTLQRATKAEPFGYIVKPYQIAELRAALAMALYKQQRDRERQDILEKTVGGSIQMLADIMAVVEPQAFGRAQKLKVHISTLAAALGAAPAWELEAAALLSPIGWVLLPASLLQKHRMGTPLNKVEQDMLQRCPEFGSELLKRIPRLETVAQIVLFQHKNFDGNGYPRDTLSGIDIPLGARMLLVLEDFLRLEESGLNKGRIIEQLRSAKGRYDPLVLDQAIVTVIDAPPPGARPVKMADLKVGQTLKASIETIDGTLLVASETQITPVVLRRLQNFMQLSGVKEPIYVAIHPGDD